MSTREIVTLQFGHYSNFVGTHWWNVQELAFEYSPNASSEINNDVLYREGQTQKGESTFTPRTLLVDLKGSLKSLPEKGELYDPLPEVSNVQVPWDPKLIDVKNEPKIDKNEYQQYLDNAKEATTHCVTKYNFEETVDVWSDFLYTRFHPRTVNIIKQYEHGNDDVAFDVYPLGTTLWNTEQFEEEFGDKIRSYVEECDSFQGFHILGDATNAFAGLSIGCMEHIKDEYERKSILTFPVVPSYYPDYSYSTDKELQASQVKDSIRIINLALYFEKLAESCSLYVPICVSKNKWRQPSQQRQFNHLSYDNKLPYHTSAILASALDTFTLKYRLKNTHFSLSDLCVDLNSHGRKLAAASLCLPFSLNRDTDFIDCLNNWQGSLSQSITPNCNIGTDRQMQIVSLRGITEDRLKQPLEKAVHQREMPAYKCDSINEMLSFYLACTCFGSASNVTTITKALSVGTPFPKIFDQYVGVDGNIETTPKPADLYPKSVPVLAGLHSGKEVGDMLESLHTEARRIKLPRFHQFRAAGLEDDEFTQCLDKLFDLRECYEDNYLI